jgi:hypothetical protein
METESVAIALNAAEQRQFHNPKTTQTINFDKISHDPVNVKKNLFWIY